MNIELICAACGHELSLEPQHAGKKVRCPGCQGVLRVPGGAAPAVDHGRRGASPRHGQSGGSSAGHGTRAHRRRKQGPPVFLTIAAACLLGAGLCYPLFASSRQKAALRQLDADYELAAGKLAAKDAEGARSYLHSTTTRIKGLDWPELGPYRFRHHALHAEALIAINQRDEAAKEVELATPFAAGPADKARLEYLRARSHPKQKDYELIGGYYLASLEAVPDKIVARYALEYFHEIVKTYADDVRNWRKDVALYVEHSEQTMNDVLARASAAKLPERRRNLDESIANLNAALSSARSLVAVAAKADEQQAKNFESMILLAAEEAAAEDKEE